MLLLWLAPPGSMLVINWLHCGEGHWVSISSNRFLNILLSSQDDILAQTVDISGVPTRQRFQADIRTRFGLDKPLAWPP